MYQCFLSDVIPSIALLHSMRILTVFTCKHKTGFFVGANDGIVALLECGRRLLVYTKTRVDVTQGTRRSGTAETAADCSVVMVVK
jgi:hypothetical protein